MQQKLKMLRKGFLRTGFLSLAIMGQGIILPSSTVFAQNNDRVFSAEIGEVANKVLIDANNKKFEAAIKKLNATLIRSNLSAYERSTLYQMLGHYNYELDRIDEAIRAFQNAVKAEGLISKEVDNINVVISQLSVMNERNK